MGDSIGLWQVYLAAIGGQGGNLLTDWLFGAALEEGHRAQATALPGLSQRAGATSFYCEIARGSQSAGQPGVVFGLYPAPGEVDLIVAQELLELGRALEQGYAAQGTTVVASSHRVYTVAEKVPAWGEEVDPFGIRPMAERLCERAVWLDGPGLAERHGLGEMGVNAILLGAVCASRTLPISEGSFLRAVNRVGVAPEMNARAFQVGKAFVETGGAPEADHHEKTDVLEDLVARRASELRQGDSVRFRNLAARALSAFHPRLQGVLTEALYRLVDFQGPAYAEDYLKWVGEIYAQDSEERSYALTAAFAQGLALLMTYEDLVRVAQLKARKGRLRDIAQHFGVRAGQWLRVTDLFAPEVAELWGILPHTVGRLLEPLPPLRALGSRRLSLAVDSTSPWGLLLLLALGALRPLRPRSYRFRAAEAPLLREYIQAVGRFAGLDYDLGCLAARMAQMVVGYGATRRRAVAGARYFLGEVLEPLVEREQCCGQGRYPLAVAVGHEAMRMALSDEDGHDKVAALRQQVVDGLDRGEYLRLLERFAAPGR